MKKSRLLGASCATLLLLGISGTAQAFEVKPGDIVRFDYDLTGATPAPPYDGMVLWSVTSGWEDGEQALLWFFDGGRLVPTTNPLLLSGALGNISYSPRPTGYFTGVGYWELESLSATFELQDAFAVGTFPYDSPPRKTALIPMVITVTTPVTIDIKPSRKPGKPNVIDLKKDKNLKVAIMGSGTFDALQVDPATVKFGTFDPDAASPIRFKGQDYNRDGFSDLILTFKLKETGIDCLVNSATLTGHTRTDPVINITGTDSFTVEPCP